MSPASPHPLPFPLKRLHEVLVRISPEAGSSFAGIAPELEGRLSARDLSRWAGRCRNLLLEIETRGDRVSAWELAGRYLPTSPELTLELLQQRQDLISLVGGEALTNLADMALRLLKTDRERAAGVFHRLAASFGRATAETRPRLLDWISRIAEADPRGVVGFLGKLPELQKRLPPEALEEWIVSGIEVAQSHGQAAQAYFAVESAASYRKLEAWQSEVTLTENKRVLELYSEAMAGREIGLKSTDDLPRGLELLGRDLPTSDGQTLYLPTRVNQFDHKDQNFSVYKVTILHQLSFQPLRTFDFDFEQCLQQVPAAKRRLGAAVNRNPDSSPLTQLFGAFSDSRLAHQLFFILEDSRIDAWLERQYKGIRRDLARLKRHSLKGRPAPQELPLRLGLVEALVQFSLGGGIPDVRSPDLGSALADLMGYVRQVEEPGASVYTTVRAAMEAYDLIGRLAPSRRSTEVPTTEPETTLDPSPKPLPGVHPEESPGAAEDPAALQQEETVEPVTYRGVLDPELIHKRLQLEELTEELDNLSGSIPPDILKDLLEKDLIKITGLRDGDVESSGLSIADLEGAGRSQEHSQEDGTARVRKEIEHKIEELAEELGGRHREQPAFFYDEWDYLIQDYRRRWCRVVETVLEESDPASIGEARRQNTDLLVRVRRQFELLRPELLKKIKRLVDGDEIDLDSVVETLTDRRAGLSPSEKVYVRRSRRERDVAAVFLLDLSASTDSEVAENAMADTKAAKSRPALPPSVLDDDLWEPAMLVGQASPPRRRVIDVEKEAVVLMAEALETLGDTYAVYGFSGYGRNQVDFLIAKDFRETYSERVAGRIASMKPQRSTRMGPAIRHAAGKLERQDARIKALLILSDGYPQDFDYGKDRASKEYGIQDTMMSVREAQVRGIQTFFVTVDPAGHDYLREICPNHQYLVIEDIRALPNELPKVYRSLTT